MSARKLVEDVLKSRFTYKTLPIAAAIPNPPTSIENKTGMWRVQEPLIDQAKCIRCLLCWLYCPDASIKRGKDDRVEIDYDYCKGCGICMTVCPVKAISMEEV